VHRPCASPVARAKCGPVPDFGPKPASPIGRAALPPSSIELWKRPSGVSAALDRSLLCRIAAPRCDSNAS
jgi:hypothetical protein